tara:strand:+ start:566 stop:952 length:387 start_codon:yes stop_codon:yes gene_type:complete
VSTNLKDKLISSINSLESRLEEANDATALLSEVYAGQLAKGQSAIKQAGSTQSIDERINLLVTGLNEVIDISGNKRDKVKRQIQDLKLQINTLKEQLDQDEVVESPEPKEDEEVEEIREDATEDEKKN